MIERLFALTESERASPLWRRLEAELIERRAAQRIKNDNDHDAAATARIRGHIECLTSLIGLGQNWPPFATAAEAGHGNAPRME